MSAKAKKKYEKRHASRPDPIDDGIPSVEGLNIWLHKMKFIENEIH